MPANEPQGDENTGLLNYLPEAKKGGRRTRRRRLIGPLKQGLLKKVGYSVTARTSRRHAAVKRAVKKYGRTSTIRKLNAVAVYTRRTSPAKSRTFKSDMKFAQKMRGGNEETKKLEKLKNDVEVKMLEGKEEDAEGPSIAPIVRQARKQGVDIPVGAQLGEVKSAIKEKLSGR
jgi:hypothetical protein